MKYLLTSLLFFSFSHFARADFQEVPIFHSTLNELNESGEVVETNYKYVLTMFKLTTSETHPSSFQLCKRCVTGECGNTEPLFDCSKYYMAKEKEVLRCNTSRFVAMHELRPLEAAQPQAWLVVDESQTLERCNPETFDADRWVWNVKLFTDNTVVKNLVGFREVVIYFLSE